MSVNTVLLDFSIDPSRISDEVSRKTILTTIRENLVEKLFPSLLFVYDLHFDDGYMCILTEKDGVMVQIRFFNPGLITINIEYYLQDHQNPKINFDVCEIFSF